VARNLEGNVGVLLDEQNDGALTSQFLYRKMGTKTALYLFSILQVKVDLGTLGCLISCRAAQKI
jgi:hypothetical protein